MPMETDKIEHIQGVEIQEKAAAVPERQPERKAVVGNTKIERQTTGQMNIEEVLKEWERLKKENEEKRKQETVSSGMKLRISIGNSSDHLVSENIIQA